MLEVHHRDACTKDGGTRSNHYIDDVTPRQEYASEDHSCSREEWVKNLHPGWEFGPLKEVSIPRTQNGAENHNDNGQNEHLIAP